MTIGKPDWYSQGLSSSVPSTDDTAELAVRLGSPVTYDRSSKVILLDPFIVMNNLNELTHPFATIEPRITSNLFETTCSSLYCQILNNASDYFQLVRYSRAWLSTVVSVEFGLLLDQPLGDITISLDYYTGSKTHNAKVKFVTLTTELQVFKSDGTYETIHNFGISPFYSKYFSAVRLLIDSQTGYYKSLQIDSFTVDLSTYLMQSSATSTAAFARATIRINGTATQLTNMYLDRLILSEDY